MQPSSVRSQHSRHRSHFFEKGQMASAISYAYAYVLQLVEKVPPKILMSGYQNKLNLGTTSTKNLTELTASTNRKTNTFASTYAFVLQLVSDTMDVIQLWDPSHTENATQLSAISAFQTQIAIFSKKDRWQVQFHMHMLMFCNSSKKCRQKY